MASCSRCKIWMGDVTGPTPAIPGTLVCDRCRSEERANHSNRWTAVIMIVCAIIFLAVALRGEWKRTAPTFAPRVPDQVLPAPGEHPDPEPGDDGAQPQAEPPIPRAMTSDV